MVASQVTILDIILMYVNNLLSYKCLGKGIYVYSARAFITYSLVHIQKKIALEISAKIASKRAT